MLLRAIGWRSMGYSSSWQRDPLQKTHQGEGQVAMAASQVRPLDNTPFARDHKDIEGEGRNPSDRPCLEIFEGQTHHQPALPCRIEAPSFEAALCAVSILAATEGFMDGYWGPLCLGNEKFLTQSNVASFDCAADQNDIVLCMGGVLHSATVSSFHSCPCAALSADFFAPSGMPQVLLYLQPWLVCIGLACASSKFPWYYLMPCFYIYCYIVPSGIATHCTNYMSTITSNPCYPSTMPNFYIIYCWCCSLKHRNEMYKLHICNPFKSMQPYDNAALQHLLLTLFPQASQWNVQTTCLQSLQILATLWHPLPTLKNVGFGGGLAYIYIW